MAEEIRERLAADHPAVPPDVLDRAVAHVVARRPDMAVALLVPWASECRNLGWTTQRPSDD
jgi:hypothetical protein